MGGANRHPAIPQEETEDPSPRRAPQPSPRRLPSTNYTPQPPYPHLTPHYGRVPAHPRQAMLRPPNMPQGPVSEMQRAITIRNDVNLKKTTLELVPMSEPGLYGVEFSFDAAVDGSLTVYIVAQEMLEDGASVILSKYKTRTPFVFNKGLGQRYTIADQEGFRLDQLSARELQSQPQSRHFPLAIRLSAGRPEEQRLAPKAVQSQTSYATVERDVSGGFSVKVIQQKIVVSGTSYELQEIYGIDHSAEATSDDLENGRDCVICMTERRDTTVLPCRHMCMCSACARKLRAQSNKCPVCRTTVDSLLQIKVSRKEDSEPPPTPL